MGIASASSWGCELKCRSYRGVKRPRRQPLREAVSWNVYLIIIVHCSDSSASSWGCELKLTGKIVFVKTQEGQPLREAVSWNTPADVMIVDYDSQPLREAVSWNNFVAAAHILSQVSLFVRLWVEIKLFLRHILLLTVSLFVRLWVEMCEVLPLAHSCKRQPLREAVSWNVASASFSALSAASASSWGCELK